MKNGNVENVLKGVDEFNKTLNEFNDLHASVQRLCLEEDEKYADQVDWYEPTLHRFIDFQRESDN